MSSSSTTRSEQPHTSATPVITCHDCSNVLRRADRIAGHGRSYSCDRQVFHSEAYPIASPFAAKSCPYGSMLAIANARMGQLAVATTVGHRCLLTLLSNLKVQPLQPVISTCTPLEFGDSAVAPSTIVEASEAPSCSTRGLKTCCPRNF